MGGRVGSCQRTGRVAQVKRGVMGGGSGWIAVKLFVQSSLERVVGGAIRVGGLVQREAGREGSLGKSGAVCLGAHCWGCKVCAVCVVLEFG
jgi:hypothetical protein